MTINIGIMQFDRKSMALKPKWGKRLPLKTKRNASYKDILENGLAKWKVFNKAMIEENENYMLLYDDGSEAIFLPGQGKQFFVLSRYKEELGRDYRRIVLFLCKEEDFEYNYSCHVLGEDPQLQSIGEELEEEGSALKGKKVQDEEDVSGDELSHHGAQHESPKKKTKVIDDKEYGSDELTEVLNVSSNMNCPGPGSSATSSGITFSGSVPEEFLWGDFDEIDENELVRAAIARSLENQSNSTEDIELQQLIEAFQKETAHHCETCSIVVLRKKLLKTCMRAVQERSFEFTKMPCIVFSGEDSADLGGPRREFFRLLMQAVCKEFGVFEGNPNNLAFSHDHSVIASRKPFLAGQFVAWSILHGGPGPQSLAEDVFYLMLELHDEVVASRAANIIPDEGIAKLATSLQEVNSDVELQDFKSANSNWLLDQGIALHGIGKGALLMQVIKQTLFYRYNPSYTTVYCMLDMKGAFVVVVVDISVMLHANNYY